MLKLTRKELQSITITHAGERLIITVAKIKHGAIQLGFAGPESFCVMRNEIQTIKDNEQKELV